MNYLSLFSFPQDKGNVGSGDFRTRIMRKNISSTEKNGGNWRQESSNKKHDQHIT